MDDLKSPKPSFSKLKQNQPPQTDESNAFNVCPFKLKWTVGMNVDVGIVNLTTNNRNIIAYACSHVIIFYDYILREMMSLQGHKNAVRSLSASRDGKWILSADYEEDCVCILWDTETRIPICSLFNPHGKNFLTAAKISPDAKFLVTVGNERIQVVNFWLWTRGNDKPDATVELIETSDDRVKKISFNDENPAQFILTLNRGVIFVSWRNLEILEVERPTISTKYRRAIENCSDSCYVSRTLLAMTVTNNGFVLVWSDSLHNKTFNSSKSNHYRKKLVKAVPLQKGNLTSIEVEDEIITISNNAGELYFYDHQLKLLYWCNNCGFDSIVSISFDRKSGLKRPEIAASESTASEFSGEQLELEEPEESLDPEVPDEIFNLEVPDETFNLEVPEEALDPEVPEEALDLEIPEETLDLEVPEENNSNLKTETNDPEKLVVKRGKYFPDETQPLSASTITMKIDYQPKGNKLPEEPTDCNLRPAKFIISKFCISSASGQIARLDIGNLKCSFMLHPAKGAITAVAIPPNSDYVVIGNSLELLCLYKFTARALMVSKKTPALPNFRKILDFEEGKRDTNYVTSPQTHESLVGVSALKFSPKSGKFLACGLKSGVIWILDPNTLDPLDPIPFKHSACKILELEFSECGKYLAYSDDAFTVGVFKRNDKRSSVEDKIDGKLSWIFLGKYHSHYKPVRKILFANSKPGKNAIRFFSLGEDRNLVEYDLKNSGPYPEPGLKILHTEKIERTAVPFCMTIYPEFETENFLILANSECKFRLLDDQTKIIRATYRGPTFGDPVQKMFVAKKQEKKQKRSYMIFATSKEIGLMILPFDGNPHKIVAMIGHPKKIESMAVSDCGKYVFTFGQNDRSLLMWKINYRSADAMERFGGKGLLPFHSLIDGDKDGWLFNEMKDLFYYSQILQQGENTTSSRIITDKVSILQIPNLMRAIGFYPTNYELENMMEEVSYKKYSKTGQLISEITFEDFVKLYINHRPTFGITKKQIKDAFKAFIKPESLDENPALTAEQFLEVLFGRGRNIENDPRFSSDKLYGEPLSVKEAHTYLRRLVPQDEDSASYSDNNDDRTADMNFDFLPQSITYENFTEEILGIGRLE